MDVIDIKIPEINTKDSGITLSLAKNEMNTRKQLLESQFKSFKLELKETIVDIEKTISLNSDVEPVQLETDLNDWVSYAYWVGKALADANDYLSLFQLLSFCPKSKDLSENDRKAIVELGTIVPRNLLSKLKVLERALERKISVGQSILRYETARYVREK